MVGDRFGGIGRGGRRGVIGGGGGEDGSDIDERERACNAYG